MVQRRAARFVYNVYDSTASIISMLQSLQWPYLELRRNFLKLLLMFKTLHEQIHIPTNNFQRVTIKTRG